MPWADPEDTETTASVTSLLQERMCEAPGDGAMAGQHSTPQARVRLPLSHGQHGGWERCFGCESPQQEPPAKGNVFRKEPHNN